VLSPTVRINEWFLIVMAEGYCVKCKAKKEIVDAVEEVMKNGRKAIKGKCPDCGTVMFKILGGKAVPPTPVPVSQPPAVPAKTGDKGG
jgi:Zn finger protein HypA/HybF involved in hydrogenase expression